MSLPPAGACDAPIIIESFFTSERRDTGKRCQRAAGHDGAHRWEQQWVDLTPAAVEARIAELAERWDED